MRRSLAVLLVATSLVALPTGAGAVPTERAAGSDRVLTAVALSQAAFTAADAAVVASSATFADALGAAPLAATLGGPLLLTPPDALRDEVGAELGRLGVATVHLMGGTGAISVAVEEALEDDGYEVIRHAGTNRFDTAALAAAAQATANGDAPVERVYVALGSHPDDDSKAWPDALAAGVLAGVQDQPILLVTPSAVPSATQQAITDLDPDEVVVIGGTGAIPDEVMDDLGPDGTTRRRIGGASRYDTAGLLADAPAATAAASRSPRGAPSRTRWRPVQRRLRWAGSWPWSTGVTSTTAVTPRRGWRGGGPGPCSWRVVRPPWPPARSARSNGRSTASAPRTCASSRSPSGCRPWQLAPGSTP